MTQFHPNDATLADYAAGGLCDGLSLMVAAHATYCPSCRARIAALEAIGGAVLAGEVPPAGVQPPSLSAVWDRLDLPEVQPPPQPRHPVVRGNPPILPKPILDRLPGDIGSLAWKFRLPGISEYVMEGFGDETVSLLRARPGVGMFAHTHRGEEATLILSGQMKDGGRVYRRGDVALADQSDDHRPEIIGNEVCICLIVMSGGMRFTGPFSRFLNIFTG